MSSNNSWRDSCRVETARPVVATATVAATMCVKQPDFLKDMLVRAKLQFQSFDNATQPQKPHRESVRPVFALCHDYKVILSPVLYFRMILPKQLWSLWMHRKTLHTPQNMLGRGTYGTGGDLSFGTSLRSFLWGSLNFYCKQHNLLYLKAYLAYVHPHFGVVTPHIVGHLVSLVGYGNSLSDPLPSHTWSLKQPS